VFVAAEEKIMYENQKDANEVNLTDCTQRELIE
jgi:hypothetical protein